jgi:hypothetical protein
MMVGVRSVTVKYSDYLWRIDAVVHASVLVSETAGACFFLDAF